MLVDDDAKNIEKVNEFVKSMGTRKEWLEKNGLSIEDIQKVKFEGVQAPMNRNGKVVGDANYLERVQEFISANLAQEPIYENLRKEEPIYQNLQDTQRQSPEEKPPQLPPKKRKLNTDSGIAVSDKDRKQVYTETISLVKEFKAIKAFFKDYAQKVINTICDLFRREVATKIEGQGYNVSSKQGSSEITVKGSKPIDASRINKDIIVESLAQIIEKREKIKDLGNNYKGDQLGREISKLLNAGSQKKNINSNYNDGEPIFQTREEALNYPPQKKDINSNSVRGNYNYGESIFQTVQEAHQQKKNTNSNPVSKKPLALPVPPKNYTEKVTQNRNNNIIERGG
ncbi:hypothetical protein [Wolbachia endosymbiont of Oedothorax gibbosus]|uniref:hypothetical protein n=1 Tax=Wolbachia endosymbiont of Oedothorax gibbosus TaxID=931100 RepID=UPI002024465D|nr:hypothetical protein [Wolbachia endosymbiont of Oedothorax gibbosus]